MSYGGKSVIRGCGRRIIREVAYGWRRSIIRGVAYGGRGIIVGGLLYIPSSYCYKYLSFIL